MAAYLSANDTERDGSWLCFLQWQARCQINSDTVKLLPLILKPHVLFCPLRFTLNTFSSSDLSICFLFDSIHLLFNLHYVCFTPISVESTSRIRSFARFPLYDLKVYLGNFAVSANVGGGFSPGKLETVILGLEKREVEDEEFESNYPSRSLTCRIDEAGGSTNDNWKDFEVVSSLSECSKPAGSLGSEMFNDQRSGIKNQEETTLDYDYGLEIANVPSGERSSRVPLATLSKPSPSKWDDAQKWIASPTSNGQKAGQSQGEVVGSRKVSGFGYGARYPSTKVVVEVPDQKMVAFEEPDTKQMDTNPTKLERDGQKFVSWEDHPHPYPIGDSYAKPVLMVENSIRECSINHSRYDASVGMQNETNLIPPPSTPRSVSMRDMGTEMTPIASQEPSRTGTPVRATTPMPSPTSSRQSTLKRSAPTSPNNQVLPNEEMSEEELQVKTRREIMVLGTKLGKMNIAAWASKEEENKDASSSLKTIATLQVAKSVIETRAAAWEEAEKAKYTARFKREELKIEAWENHQKAKAEAEMKKMEVEVERMRGRAHDKIASKLASVWQKAEERRANAEAKRSREAVKIEQQVDYIQRTGRIPSGCPCCW